MYQFEPVGASLKLGLMRWIKDNWLAAVILVGIVLSLATVRHDGNERANRDRVQTVTDQLAGCERAGLQKALSARGWLAASDARRADGDKKPADYYEGIADGIILTIPAPPGLEGDRRMSEVAQQRIKGKLRYVLTPRAESLQREGCRLAYS